MFETVEIQPFLFILHGRQIYLHNCIRLIVSGFQFYTMKFMSNSLIR